MPDPRYRCCWCPQLSGLGSDQRRNQGLADMCEDSIPTASIQSKDGQSYTGSCLMSCNFRYIWWKCLEFREWSESDGEKWIKLYSLGCLDWLHYIYRQVHRTEVYRTYGARPGHLVIRGNCLHVGCNQIKNMQSFDKFAKTLTLTARYETNLQSLFKN